MDAHQRLFGQIETILAGLPPSALKSLRGTHPRLPAHVRAPLWQALHASNEWMDGGDVVWLARAWAQYKTDPGPTHDSASIAAAGAALGLRARLRQLWGAPWPQAPCRGTIEYILDRARQDAYPVCFAQLAQDVTWLRANQTVDATGRTRAQRVIDRWQTDASAADLERTDNA